MNAAAAQDTASTLSPERLYDKIIKKSAHRLFIGNKEIGPSRVIEGNNL